MKRTIVAALAVTALVAIGSLQTADAQATPAAKAKVKAEATPAAKAKVKAEARADLDRRDRDFVKEAYQANLAEIRLAELAQERAKGKEAKDLARHLVKDHQKAQKELERVAQQAGLELKEELTATQTNMLARLQKLEGEEFDSKFVDEAVKSHKKAITDYERAAKEAKDDDVRAYAEKTLPGLRQHLEHAEKLAGAEERPGKAKRERRRDEQKQERE